MSRPSRASESSGAAESREGFTDEMLSEWDESDRTFELSEADVDVLEEQVNFDSDRGESVTRLAVEYQRDGSARFRSKQFVGAISLPDGPTIRVSPKAGGGNFLHLLRYARGASTRTIGEEAEYEGGRSFLDALAALYADELQRILNRGLQKQYTETRETRSHVRGRIDLQRQLQEQGPVATEFECVYEELTTDMLANQAVLSAAQILTGLTADDNLERDLDWQAQRLRRAVTNRRLSPAEFDEISFNRLDDYYTDILRLAEPIIKNTYFENIEAGIQGAYSFLVNMNTVFERAVERGLETLEEVDPAISVTPQDRTRNLLSGSPTVTMRPDAVVREEGAPRLVVDAKWKTGSVSNSDLYQITAYSLAYDCPGVLIYPSDSDNDLETEYEATHGERIRVVQVGVDDSIDDYRDFQREFGTEFATLM